MPQSSILSPCADPGFFSAVGGCPDGRKQSVFSPQLILQFAEGVKWFYLKKTVPFPRIQRGSNIFQEEWGGGGGRVPYNL